MSSFRGDRTLTADAAKRINAWAAHPLENNHPESVDAAQLQALLEEGVHGFCYSAYEHGQQPGDQLTIDQIRRRMSILKPHTSWIRSFSCIEGNELIAQVAKEMGMKTLVGAWIGDDPEKNKQEVEGLIRLAKEGLVDVAAVGNEVLYRNDLSKEELIDTINYVKDAIPHVEVGYVDAYYEFVRHPDLTAVCDILFCNCYPFWESCPFHLAAGYMKDMYHQVLGAGGGNKRVIIAETGWPSAGTAIGGAQPSMAFAAQYFINTMLWAKQNEIEVFYFTSFDEAWKTAAEGDVGAYWGIWDANNQLKFG